ncbi:putative glycosyl hydrolase [Phaeomoniella chlamydospora]|uniref:Putative glycosyl hydrolase n=1 Tax=Phaeomoniella chlamydospora TaxID=158046 RepID=A0A0G2EJK5_PHACM|nr:putative glycosyl hydrolase [Phaeomoniella chlamydospora]
MIGDEPESHSHYAPIENYGLVGDMHTCALVGQNGSIDFMCWPKLDSPSLFCRLLDYHKGGHFSIGPSDAIQPSSLVTKQQYLSLSNILQTRWISEGGVVNLYDFFAVSAERASPKLTQNSEAKRSPILIRRLECVRGQMELDIEMKPQFNYAQDKCTVDKTSRCGHTHLLDQTDHDCQQYEVQSESFDLHLELMASKVDASTPPTTPRMSHAFDRIGPNEAKSAVQGKVTLREGDHVYLILRELGRKDKFKVVDPAGLERTTQQYWKTWIRQCKYRGRFLPQVERSLLLLKLLTYQPTGAIVAAPTFSLPEAIGGTRNWDYRYSWVRDTSFTLYVFLRLGFVAEAEAYIEFIFRRIADWHDNHQGEPLPLMFSIDGESDLPERELSHLEGYKNTKPVRIGNAATGHIQLDIYGELMDAIYLYNKHGKPIAYDQWLSIRRLIDYVTTIWKDPDMSIWEVRGKKENFCYSKMMLWVSVDRALRLCDKRPNLPCPQRWDWLRVRDEIYESVMEHGFNRNLNTFVQSYESFNTVDSALLIAPLVFFIAPNDPRFLGTLDRILLSPEKGGLNSGGLVFRYDHNAVDDGVGGVEGSFTMCTFWLVEALIRAGVYNPKYLEAAKTIFESVTSFSNHLGMYSEEISLTGEQLGNTPQAFSHLAFISAAFNLDRVEEKGSDAGFVL